MLFTLQFFAAMAEIRHRVSTQIRTPSGRTWNDICSQMPIVNTTNLEKLVFNKIFASNDTDVTSVAANTLQSLRSVAYDQNYEEYYYDYDADSGKFDEDLFTVFDPDLVRERAGVDYYPEPYCSIVDEAVGELVNVHRTLSVAAFNLTYCATLPRPASKGTYWSHGVTMECGRARKTL